MKRDASEVIAACPFCGMDGKAKVYKSSDVEFYVACIGDFPRNGCSGAAFGATPDKAIAAWNKRATLPAAEPADAGRDAVAWMHPDYAAGNYRSAMSPVSTYYTNGWLPLAYARPPSEAATAVDDAMVERAVEAFLANTGQAHTVTQLQRDLTTGCMRAALTAALASQQAVKP